MWRLVETGEPLCVGDEMWAATMQKWYRISDEAAGIIVTDQECPIRRAARGTVQGENGPADERPPNSESAPRCPACGVRYNLECHNISCDACVD
jgi:hypothetical protein